MKNETNLNENKPKSKSCRVFRIVADVAAIICALYILASGIGYLAGIIEAKKEIKKAEVQSSK